MSFETLSERYEFFLPNFPEEWLPLTYLYDPDLPLFPLVYFHEVDPSLPHGARPGSRDRVFGFVHHIALHEEGARVVLATNKDLEAPKNGRYREVAEVAVRQRLGMGDPVIRTDVTDPFRANLKSSNSFIRELWYQVVDGSFGKALPFGRLWDPVFGLERFIASWNSDGGRKGELIQTHYFLSAFGEQIPVGGGFHADFYLLPTWQEFTDRSNPLSLFSKFAELQEAATAFTSTYGDAVSLGRATFSSFDRKKTGSNGDLIPRLKKETVLDIYARLGPGHQRALLENYGAFDRGPMRSVISLLMHHDLRNGLWSPEALDSSICAAMYPSLEGTYQSPKVIQLYSQLCFGSKCALPIDNWVEAFLKWPLHFRSSRTTLWHHELFQCCDHWGKIERLIWLASQARKVHASVCADILWCVRFGNPDGKLRGANPLGCKLCDSHIRAECPAHQSILDKTVAFNSPPARDGFSIVTSGGNNVTTGQSILSCVGKDLADEYSVTDRPHTFAKFPSPGHDGAPISVRDFLLRY